MIYALERISEVNFESITVICKHLQMQNTRRLKVDKQMRRNLYT